METHLHRLKKNRVILVRDMLPDSLADHLLAEDILSNEEYEQVMTCNQTTAGRNRKMLDIVATKGPNGYNELREALTVDHGWLVTVLDQTPAPAPSGNKEEESPKSTGTYSIPEAAIDFVVRSLLSSGSLFAWKFVGRKLGFREDQLNEIEYRSPRDIRAQIYEMFFQWKYMKGQDASIETLSLVLKEEGRIATAEALQSGTYYS